MYWGATEDPRLGAKESKSRRRLAVAVAVTVLSGASMVGVAFADSSYPAAQAVAVGSRSGSLSSPPLQAAPTSVTTAREMKRLPSPSSTTSVAPPSAAPAPPKAPARPAAPPAAPTIAATTSPPVSKAPVVIPAPRPPAPAVDAADTCGAALAYLSAHSAPGFRFECPGNALGHQAMTCVNVAGVCPGYKLIAISVVCPASYMNEAHNSWILSGLATGSIDPYGYCH